MAIDNPDIAGTIEQAIEQSGLKVLATLGTGAHKLTREEVDQFHEDNPQVVGAYAGPYTDEEDQRNQWTADQGVVDSPVKIEADKRREAEATPAPAPLKNY